MNTYGDRGATTIYIYRVKPKILRPERQAYIELIPWESSAPAFCEDRILDVHGSGVYKLMFNDDNKRPHVGVAECVVDLNDPSRPAVLNVEELDRNDPGNRAYIAHLRQSGKWPEEPKESKAGGTDILMEKLVDKVLDRQEESMPDKVMDRAVDMLGTAYTRALEVSTKAHPPQEGGDLVPLLKLMLAREERRNDRLEERLNSLIIAERRPPESLTDRIRELNELKELMGDKSELDIKGMVVEVAKHVGPAIGAYVAAQQGAPAAPAAAPLPQQIQTQETRSSMDAKIQDIARKGIRLFLAGTADGASFGRTVMLYEDDGPAIMATFKQMGVEGLITALKGHSAAWSLLSLQEADLREFLAEALKATDAEEDKAAPKA